MIRIIKHLLPLFIVQFFTWISLFSLWIYATPVITRYVFKSTDAESPAFENGITWVGICFAFYTTLAAFLIFLIPKLSKHFSKERMHAVALLAGGAGLLLMSVIKDQYVLIIPFVFIGIAWSSISNIPYSIISETTPENKLAAYFAVFNFSVVVPQVTAAFLLGYITRHFFNGETIHTILLGGCSMLFAGLLMLFVKHKRYRED